MGCAMSKIDLLYIGTVLFAFLAFAGVLAYYSQTCAEPKPARREPAKGTPRMAVAH
jgi:hypothetical protein